MIAVHNEVLLHKMMALLGFDIRGILIYRDGAAIVRELREIEIPMREGFAG
jgi:hypothetical protein